tara:strand:- start:1465 stop:2061 length:597 start_codon:yes stop_codon:yes gene_type:complete
MKIDSIHIILKFSKVISIVSLVISSLITLLLLYLLFGGSLEGSIMVDSSINQMKELKEYTNFNLVPFLIKLFMVLFIVTILILINTILRSWENFMSLVEQGRCFEIDTIKNLKYISFILTGIWAVLFISDIITETTVFTSISFQNTINDYSPSESLNSFDASFSLPSLAYLLVATILWVISHILIQGIKLKKENELTI